MTTSAKRPWFRIPIIAVDLSAIALGFIPIASAAAGPVAGACGL